MALTNERIEEEGICPTCRGAARYSVSKTDKEGNITVEYKECLDCDGTGYQTSDGDVD